MADRYTYAHVRQVLREELGDLLAPRVIRRVLDRLNSFQGRAEQPLPKPTDEDLARAAAYRRKLKR